MKNVSGPLIWFNIALKGNAINCDECKFADRLEDDQGLMECFMFISNMERSMGGK
jgi:hypothetical protein